MGLAAAQILFVLSDDQDAMLNAYSTDGIPHMTRLNGLVRQRGALFTNYVLAYPLCSPSRTALLTGTFPHNHGLTDNSRLNVSHFHPEGEKHTAAVWMQDAGYHTMLVGKYVRPQSSLGPLATPHSASYHACGLASRSLATCAVNTSSRRHRQLIAA